LTILEKTAFNRLVSIDALRAIVMVLMIFVNDLWTLVGIPAWLEHAPGDANYMGLADVVFPAFLFIVGLSVPYAIESRKNKGDSEVQIFFHIVSRSVALIVMGYFHVNLEIYDSTTAVLSKPLWQIGITLSFFLIWLDYTTINQFFSKILKLVGILLLILLAVLFKSGDSSGFPGMQVQWWGILGLIGWAYLISTSIFLFTKGLMYFQLSALILLIGLNAAHTLGWINIFNGAMSTLPMAGIITALLYKKYGSKNRVFWIGIGLFALLLILFGFLTEPLWGISKIRATASWTTICAAITIFAFGIMVYLTEVLNEKKWYEFIKPAGTSTLTCYLLPYIHYALIVLLGLPQLPVMLRTGGIGLFKSLLYALTIVAITGLLGKVKIRLKI
jgi:predicted acyltransferase